MKKRVLSFLLVTMLLLAAMPRSTVTLEAKSSIIIPNYEHATTNIIKIKDNVYNKLKDFYKDNFGPSIDIKGTCDISMKKEDVYDALSAGKNAFFKFIEGSYFESIIDSVSSAFAVYPDKDNKKWIYEINLRINLRHSMENENEINAYIDKFIKDNALDKKKTDYDIIKAVHDYIITHAAYIAYKRSDGSMIIPETTKSGASTFSPYAIVKDGLGVCNSYASLFQKFMEKLGIESYFVSGILNGGGHAWNLVKVDGKYYNIDLTMNDPLKKNMEIQEATASGLERYKYFLLSDKSMGKNYTRKTMLNIKAEEDYRARPSGKPGQ